MKRVLFVVAIVCLTSVWPAFGCQLAGNSYHEFPEAEYVFVGTVTGYTDAVSGKSSTIKLRAPDGNEKTPTAFGLKVEPIGVLNAPTIPEKYFEVFPLKLWADCSESGSSLDDLKKEYPTGTELRVVMKDATIFTEKTPSGVVRLEEMLEIGGSIVDNDAGGGRYKTTIDSFFDYRSFRYDPKGADWYLQLCLVEFELRKDLYRLELTKTRAERQAIMKRLQFAPNGTDFDLKLIRFYYKN